MTSSREEEEWELTLPVRPALPGQAVSGEWHIHKRSYDPKSGRPVKIEACRYLPRRALDPLVKYLRTKSFQYEEDSAQYPPAFGLLKSLEGKTHSADGGPHIKPNEHAYKTHFCRVAIHRNQLVLVRVYECLTNGFDQIKIELTYRAHRRGSPRKARGTKRTGEKLRALGEIQKRIDRRFPDDGTIFIDHGGVISEEEFLHEAEQEKSTYARLAPKTHGKRKRKAKE